MGIGDLAGPLSIDQLNVERTGAATDVAVLAAEVDWQEALPSRAWSPAWKLQRVIKRGCDIVASIVLLTLLSPLLLAITVLAVLDDGWPVLYPWRVVGERGRRFTGYKFRTMVRDADRLKAELLHLNEMSGPVFKLRDDPRITSVGKWLRRYSLDELPQLWSVLKGDMSLVGPRPMFPHEFAQASAADRAKLSVSPGMTCLWQVSGRSDITSFEEWVRLDFDYIRDWNLLLDFQILFRTAIAVVGGRGAR